MTLQACIEGCFGTPVTAYQYKYAAVNNDTCHCYADIFSSGKHFSFNYSPSNMFNFWRNYFIEQVIIKIVHTCQVFSFQ